jgi:pantetheine-phosphate adenylyltransferase
MREPAAPRIAIYPGSFDPITCGHEDIVRRALRFVDRVIVAVAHRATHAKQGLFPIGERVEMIREVFADEAGVDVVQFTGLLVEFARERDARLIIRGLRAVSDFEYEFQMAATNARLCPEIETMFLMASETNQFISSRFVKEIARLGGDVSRFVSPTVAEHLVRKSAAERRRAAAS